MDRYGLDSLRHQFIPSSAAMAMDGQGHLLNESRYNHFLDCYWRHFHPFFPIIHYSALALGPPPPLLALMMVTIGAMLSSSPDHSVAFYKFCVGFFKKVCIPFKPTLPSSQQREERKRKKIFLIVYAAAPRNYNEFSIIRYADGYSAGGLFQVFVKGSKV